MNSQKQVHIYKLDPKYNNWFYNEIYRKKKNDEEVVNK